MLMLKRSYAKYYGEVAETRFVLKCYELGLFVSRPTCDMGQYDYIVDNGFKLLKIQVKSTGYDQTIPAQRAREIARGKIPRTTVGRYRRPQQPRFGVNLTWGQRPHIYGRKAFDILAVYIHPLDLWYLIPRRALGNKLTLTFTLKNKLSVI